MLDDDPTFQVNCHLYLEKEEADVFDRFYPFIQQSIETQLIVAMIPTAGDTIAIDFGYDFVNWTYDKGIFFFMQEYPSVDQFNRSVVPFVKALQTTLPKYIRIYAKATVLFPAIARLLASDKRFQLEEELRILQQTRSAEIHKLTKLQENVRKYDTQIREIKKKLGQVPQVEEELADEASAAAAGAGKRARDEAKEAPQQQSKAEAVYPILIQVYTRDLRNLLEELDIEVPPGASLAVMLPLARNAFEKRKDSDEADDI
jgi:hypothetical protein